MARSTSSTFPTSCGSRRGERVTTLVRGLAGTRTLRPDVELRHAIMGLWTDRQGNVYAADYANGQVKRITPSGRVTVIAESHLPWAVTGWDHRAERGFVAARDECHECGAGA